MTKFFIDASQKLDFGQEVRAEATLLGRFHGPGQPFERDPGAELLEKQMTDQNSTPFQVLTVVVDVKFIIDNMKEFS